jgi:hypothetical protein
MPFNAMPAGSSRREFTAMLFQREPLGAPKVLLPPLRGDPVNVLWLLPITESERATAMGQGSAKLAELLAKAGHGFVHRDRESVA